MSGSQGCADISIETQRFVPVSANQPGTSVLLSLPTILKRIAHKVIHVRDYTSPGSREPSLLQIHRTNCKHHSVCIQKKLKKMKEKKDFAALYDPSEQNIDL